MSRLVFSSFDDFLFWLSDKTKEGRYDLYVTEDHEFITCPKRSTRPLLYAYYRSSQNNVVAQQEEIQKNVGIGWFKVKSFDWKEDSPVGSVFTVE